MTAATQTEEDDFRTGGLQAQERATAEEAVRRAGRGRTEWITSLLKNNNDSVIIRWVVDEPDWIETMQHTYVPTKSAPADKPADANWPERTGAVCRKTERANGASFYDDCYVCDHMKQKNGKPYSRGLRMWSIAVIRKEVRGTEEMAAKGMIRPDQIGQRVGITDDIVEVDEVKDGKATGKKVPRKHYVVVNMALKNFFSDFIQFAKYYETALDRDYIVTRVGEGTDSTYKSVPLDVIQKAVKDAEGNVTGVEPYDLRNPKIAEQYADHGIKLGDMVKHRMSDEYYARYFDPTKVVPWKTSKSDDEDDDAATSSSSTKPETASAEPATDVATQERLAAMRARITEGNPVRSEGGATNLMDFS